MPHALPDAGQRFDGTDWKFLRVDRKRSKREKHLHVWCKCMRCNKTVRSVAVANIFYGASKSCGCDKMTKMHAARSPDLTGKEIWVHAGNHEVREPGVNGEGERWGIILGLDESKTAEANDGNRYWRVKCTRVRDFTGQECGNEYVAATGSILSGRRRSCGCLKKDQLYRLQQKRGCDYTNKRQGRLFITGRNGTGWAGFCRCNPEIKQRWELPDAALADFCKEHPEFGSNYTSQQLHRGKKSCGCLARETAKAHLAAYRAGTPIRKRGRQPSEETARRAGRKRSVPDAVGTCTKTHGAP